MSNDYSEKTVVETINRSQFIEEEGIIHFGERIKILMGDMSYRAFAEQCNMSEKVIRNYVAGKSYPSLDRLAKLAKANNVSTTWLAFGETYNDEDKNPQKLVDDDQLMKEMMRDWERVFSRLTLKDKVKITDFIAIYGIKSLIDICNETNSEFLSLRQSIKDLALQIRDYPDSLIREILSKIERNHNETKAEVAYSKRHKRVSG